MEESGKRKTISPPQDRSGKTPRMEITISKLDKTIEQCDREITELKRKENPSLADIMQQLDLMSRRSDAKASRERALDRIELEEVVIPKIVDAALDQRIADESGSGGFIYDAIQQVVREETAQIRSRLVSVEKAANERKTACFVPTKAKWNDLWTREKRRAITEAEKGLVVFGKDVLEGESGKENDEMLRQCVADLTNEAGVGNADIWSWRRLAKPQEMANSQPLSRKPKILIRLRSKEARDKILEAAKRRKDKSLKREIPQLLMKDFLELNTEAQQLRNSQKCQTYVGFAGEEVFLWKREDETKKWKTVMRR